MLCTNNISQVSDQSSAVAARKNIDLINNKQQV